MKKFDENSVLYLEMGPAGVAHYGHRYFSVKPSRVDPLASVPVMYMADRAWEYNTKTNEVKWIKNRYLGLMAPIDKREFLLVQVAATPIKPRWP